MSKSTALVKVNTSIVPAGNVEIINSSGVGELLSQIRPHWQSKKLIQRVQKLLAVDPSSACQRIFNACIHDLKEKIIVAGLDIATEAAKQNRLPPIAKPDDVEKLSTSRTLELAHYMGLLTRAEYRKLTRVYDIRRDLEHEDDEYEASVEDCFYTFKTTIEIVLSRDPVHLLKLTDIKEIVEEPDAITLSDSVITDYQSAPNPRQLEIYRFLFYSVQNTKHPEIIRQNCFNSLKTLRAYTNNPVIIDLANEFSEKLGRRTPTFGEVRLCFAAGILPYLKRANLAAFFGEFYKSMAAAGYSFTHHTKHGELLRNFRDVGGLDFCPEALLKDIVEWLVLCYIGEPSFGPYSRSRKVFYSNVGAPLALKILTECQKDIFDLVDGLAKTSKEVKSAIKNDKHVAARYKELLDAIEAGSDEEE